MTDTTIKVKTNESEIIEAIVYMYGISHEQANRTLEEGHYTKDEIYKAVAYFRTIGMPVEMKSDRAKKELPNVIKDYESLF